MKKFFTKLLDYFCFLIFKQKKVVKPATSPISNTNVVYEPPQKVINKLFAEPPLLVLSESNLDKGLCVMVVGGTARVFPSNEYLQGHPKAGKKHLGNLVRSRCRKHFGATNTDGPTHTCNMIHYNGYGYEVKRLR